MKVIKEGSVRVDLVGGTLDLQPIALILKDVVTINMATTLKAKVELETIEDRNILEIYSADYQKSYQYHSHDFKDDNFYKDGALSAHFFKEMLFVILLCKSLECTQGIKITLSSGAPTGSGLGGSSAMGITLVQAILAFKNQSMNKNSIMEHVRKIEELMLDRGVAGYQDYFPALYGGVLALRPGILEHNVEQYYTEALASFLETHLVLVYSGQTRNSGINNWNVFKNFFDHNESTNLQSTRKGLVEIAKVSFEAYQYLRKKEYSKILTCIAREGKIREKLFPGIMTEEMKKIDATCRERFSSYQGIKVCGAGGGGCFLLVGVTVQEVESLLSQENMKILTLKIDFPLSDESLHGMKSEKVSSV